MSKTITVTAIFHPEVWINDYAVEIDSMLPFHVTLSLEEAAKILAAGDNSYETDNLWHDSSESEKVNHGGPFTIEVCEAIEDALRMHSSPERIDNV